MHHIFNVLASCILIFTTIYSVGAYDLTSADIQRILEVHNNMRAKYSMPALVWDATVAQGAKSYSDQCIWGHSPSTSRVGLGENIGYQSWSDPAKPFPYDDVALTVIDWNKEETDWTCSTNQCRSTCGHFTQIVWKKTTAVGCGLSACVFSGYKAQYLVCRYNPAGNDPSHPLNTPSSTPWCPGMPPPPPPTTSPVRPSTPVFTPTKPPPSTPVFTPTKPPPSTPVTSGSPYTGCTVYCNGVTSTCSAPPQYMGTGVYCKCLNEVSLWGVTNAGTSACTYWNPSVPKPPPFQGCKANFKNTLVPCTGYPKQYTNGKYCPCGDPQNYDWPVANLNTAECPYSSSAVSEIESNQSSTMTTGQWIGICVGIVIVAIIVIVIVVVVLNKKNTTEVI